MTRYYNGTSWQEASVRYWNGTTWGIAPVMRWNGTAWVSVINNVQDISLEAGRQEYGSDYGFLTSAPSGGSLISMWTRIPDPGAAPWSRGNMDVHTLFGADWYFRCLVGNSNSAGALNANSMLFARSDNTWIGDYSYYSDNGWTEDQVKGWIWAAWQVIIGASSIIIRQWLKVGESGSVFAAGESEITFTDARAVLVANGWSQAAADAWIPGQPNRFHIGGDNGYICHARVQAISTTPTLSALDAISNLNSADSTAWGDYRFGWVDGAADLSDRSGNNRNLSTGGTLYQGLTGPVL